ncbi:SidE phosphodiesterase domain-containing protein [Gammaproteobacteria bacterium]|nr:SidE phosphodiesterase domain-containing protein [Gammaproteobacteria bacterium]
MKNNLDKLFKRHFTDQVDYTHYKNYEKEYNNKASFQGFNSCINALFLDPDFQALLHDTENKEYWQKPSDDVFESKNHLTGTTVNLHYGGKNLINTLHKRVTLNTVSVPLNKAYATTLDVDMCYGELKSRQQTFKKFITAFPKDNSSVSLFREKEEFDEQEIASYISRLYNLKSLYGYDGLSKAGEDFSDRQYNSLDFSKTKNVNLFFSGAFMHDLFDVFHFGQTLGQNPQINIKYVIEQLAENLNSSDLELKEASLHAFEILFHCMKNVENRALSTQKAPLDYEHFKSVTEHQKKQKISNASGFQKTTDQIPLMKNINFNDYQKIEGALGSNSGGKFLAQGKTVYLKYTSKVAKNLYEHTVQKKSTKKYNGRHINRFQNEYLANQLQQLYGLSVPKIELVTFSVNGEEVIGIQSEWNENIQQYRHANPEFQEIIRQKTFDGFLVDVWLSNYDVIGLAFDNLCYDVNTLEPFRLDPGGALLYMAQGRPKKILFTDTVEEFEGFLSGHLQGFHPKVMSGVKKIFGDIVDSPKLLVSYVKFAAITEDQIRKCIQENGFSGTKSSNQKNHDIEKILIARRKTLLKKALDKIQQKLATLSDTQKAVYFKHASEALGIDMKQLDRIIEQHQCILNQEYEFNQVIKEFLHPACKQDQDAYFTSFQKNTAGTGQIKRVKHGGMHASRVAIHTSRFIDLLVQKAYQPAVDLTDKDRFLIKVSAMFHDVGREHDSGEDTKIWEENGAHSAYDWLIKKGFSEVDAERVKNAIINKDKPETHEQDIYPLILGASDSLDWVRSHSSNADTEYLPKIIKEQIPLDDLNNLQKLAKKIAVSQGDSPLSQFDIPGCFDIGEKKKFERSPNGCFSTIQENYLKNSADAEESDNSKVKSEKKQSLSTESNSDKTFKKNQDPPSLVGLIIGAILGGLYGYFFATPFILSLAADISLPAASIALIVASTMSVFGLTGGALGYWIDNRNRNSIEQSSQELELVKVDFNQKRSNHLEQKTSRQIQQKQDLIKEGQDFSIDIQELAMG